ncbi:hypothetical protein ES288_A11G327600v1 [Gossypium darwinii]|uniref:SUI1 domain-containing protein n=1 Tax=Gossypium darwinii TaxID=34276 RepID=A0A5D2ESC6_GOSDA|nr:hypothetical protein ES288_A11G327600v1 [Gossypium darwinii]
MSDLDIQIPTAFDPFADANAEDFGAGTKKSLTTVQGLKKEFSYNKILKDLKKEFCCNGTVVQDPELGQVIQLQGDQRKNVSTFLVQPCCVNMILLNIHVLTLALWSRSGCTSWYCEEGQHQNPWFLSCRFRVFWESSPYV